MACSVIERRAGAPVFSVPSAVHLGCCFCFHSRYLISCLNNCRARYSPAALAPLYICSRLHACVFVVSRHSNKSRVPRDRESELIELICLCFRSPVIYGALALGNCQYEIISPAVNVMDQVRLFSPGCRLRCRHVMLANAMIASLFERRGQKQHRYMCAYARAGDTQRAEMPSHEMRIARQRGRGSTQ